MTPEDVIELLDERRRKLGWTKAEVAARSGLPSASVRRLLSAPGQNPRLGTLLSLVGVLGMELVIQPAHVGKPDRSKVVKERKR